MAPPTNNNTSPAVRSAQPHCVEYSLDRHLRELVDERLEARIDDLAARLSELLGRQPTRRSDPLLSVSEAAEYLGLSTGTVYKRAEAGVLPCVKDGTRLLFRQADLDQYIEGNARSRTRTAQAAGLARYALRPAPTPSTLSARRARMIDVRPLLSKLPANQPEGESSGEPQSN
ncbi:helix-turn-helix domain-containing protein [Anaeromyxobacter paludicola]|uniref:helix-turn-helix domain-containing protein n=1 Tax=Anaeromyxobacter paludicola TaxID=2918171 RepID=UPI0020C0BB70|nr:helix-turn-helix domain-containing protein [Anaeromyxobacter paludicola]